MGNSRNTQPVRIVDKNGKTTTVHRRFPDAGKAGTSLPLRPVISSPQTSRKAMQTAISKAAAKVNDEMGYQFIREESLARSLAYASTDELRLVSGSLHLENFSKLLVDADVSMDEIASIAAVYDPDIAPEDKSKWKKASSYYRAINFAHNYMRGPSDDVWLLAPEDQEVRDKAKRCVAVFFAVNADGLHKPTNDITDLALNASESDYEVILGVLRNDSTASLERINFVLEGGPSAISAGAL